MNPHENAWQLFDFMSQNPCKTGQQSEYYHWVKDKNEMLIWPNRIYHLKPNLPESALEEIVSGVHNHKLPKEIQIKQEAKQESNIQNLIRKGFKVQREFPALSIQTNTNQLEYNLPPEWKLCIRQVENNKTLSDWSNLLGTGFWSNYPDVGIPLYNVYESIYNHNNRIRLFIAYVNDIPAATSMAFGATAGGGIYLVYVKAEFRKHGLGALMTKEAEQWCFQQGHETVILQATQMGEPVYKRIGYKIDFNYTILIPA